MLNGVKSLSGEECVTVSLFLVLDFFSVIVWACKPFEISLDSSICESEHNTKLDPDE